MSRQYRVPLPIFGLRIALDGLPIPGIPVNFANRSMTEAGTWYSGTIPEQPYSHGEKWFSFTPTADDISSSGQVYVFTMAGDLTDFWVFGYGESYEGGTTIVYSQLDGPYGSILGGTSLNVEAGKTYYVKVMAATASQSGTFGIQFGTIRPED